MCRQWIIDNKLKLSLHLGKAEGNLFGTQRKLKSVQAYMTISTSFSVKYLGVAIHNTLSGYSIASNVKKGQWETLIIIQAIKLLEFQITQDTDISTNCVLL